MKAGFSTRFRQFRTDIYLATSSQVSVPLNKMIKSTYRREDFRPWAAQLFEWNKWKLLIHVALFEQIKLEKGESDGVSL